MHVKNSKLSTKARFFIAWLSFFIDAYPLQLPDTDLQSKGGAG
jgi:hypothetical protein